MRIELPTVHLLWVTPNAEQIIERAGRVAYKSEASITETSAPQFIKMLISRQHEAVIEHASASLWFVFDRGVSHEEVRHRIASFTQESTRFCNYGKDKFRNEISVIQPPFKNTGSLALWEKACLCCEEQYMALIKNGEPPELARSVLPTCLKTEVVMTANFREWRHFFRLRCASAAHPQMRQVANMACAILFDCAPSVFEDLMPLLTDLEGK